MERLSPDEGPRVAEEVGRAYGEELAAANNMSPDDTLTPGTIIQIPIP